MSSHPALALAFFLASGLVVPQAAVAAPPAAPPLHGGIPGEAAQPARLAPGPSRHELAPALMPLNPDVVRQYRAAGREVPLSATEARFAGKPALTINRIQRQALASGQSLKALVLLVQFTDNPPGGPTTRFRSTVWDSMLFRDTYVRGGADTTTVRTLKRFFGEVSYGSVDVVTLDLPGATGWVTAPNNYAYYCEHDGTHENGFGPYPRNVQRLVMDAVTAANPVVDFSRYAVGGVVRNLFVVHAGSGAEWSGGADLIWSHAWSITSGDGWGNTPPPLYADGVRIDDYSMEPEAGGDTNGEAGPPMTPLLPTVGVYAHEFGHVLGLPDEYDYGYESEGTGRVSLMAGGSWNRVPDVYPDCAGNSPAHPSAWGAAYLGFVTPVTVSTVTNGITIPPIENASSGAVYKVVYPGTGGKEYWLFENRQQIGFDQGFSRMTSQAHGLCIYHVDENVLGRSFWRPNEAECVKDTVYRGQTNCNCATLPPNPANGEKWYGISLEQADGLYELERGKNGGNWQDFYSSATGATTFNGGSIPNSTSYYTVHGCTGLAAATNIQESGQHITLDLTPDSGVPLAEVWAPNGAEELGIDSSVELQWAAADMVGVTGVDLLLARDGLGGAFETIAAGIPNSGSLTWTVTGSPTTNAYLKVLAHDAAGNVGQDASDAAFRIMAATAVDDGPVAELALLPVRPSPVRGSGEIGFALPREAEARLSVFDLQGREIAVLASGILPAGRHAAGWDGRLERGTARAGLYFVVLRAEGRVLSQRLVRLQ